MRLAAALIYSGTFWMMVWFVVENGGPRRPARPRLVALALPLMAFSV